MIGKVNIRKIVIKNCQVIMEKFPYAKFWTKNMKNMYTSTYPSFTVYISWTCYPDVLNSTCSYLKIITNMKMDMT